jgi:hypothetical protein
VHTRFKTLAGALYFQLAAMPVPEGLLRDRQVFRSVLIVSRRQTAPSMEQLSLVIIFGEFGLRLFGARSCLVSPFSHHLLAVSKKWRLLRLRSVFAQQARRLFTCAPLLLFIGEALYKAGYDCKLSRN